jgi:hypothetical protein
MDMTQGPWTANMPVDARKPITIETAWKNEGAVAGVTIATVHHHGVNRLQARANARGMAVAPELIPLLEKLLPAYVPTAAAVAAERREQIQIPEGAELDALWVRVHELVRRASGID